MSEKTTERKKKKAISTVISCISWAICIAIAAMCVYIMISNVNGKVPMVFGKSVLHIVSPSMEPTIPTGTYIFIEKAKPEDISVGDVITFYSEDKSIYNLPNTHRVTAIKSENGDYIYTTKGDNPNTNPVEDKYPVKDDRLIGRYVKSLPVLTGVADFLGTKAIFFLIVIVPALLLASYQLKDVVKKAKSLKNEGKDTEAEDVDLAVKKEIERIKAEGGPSKEEIAAYLAENKALATQTPEVADEVQEEPNSEKNDIPENSVDEKR